MAKYVNQITIDGENWTLIADALSNVGIQFGSQGRARIMVADEAPDEEDIGILIDKTMEGESSTFSLSNLPLGAQVYARAEMGDDSTEIIVIAY